MEVDINRSTGSGKVPLEWGVVYCLPLAFLERASTSEAVDLCKEKEVLVIQNS